MTSETINNIPQKRGFLTRLLLALIKTFLGLIIFIGLVAGGWLGFKELRRSFNVVGGSVDRNAAQLIELQGQMNGQARELDIAQQTIAAQSNDLADMRTALRANNARQDEMLSALSDQIDGLIAVTENMTQTIGLLRDGQVSIQQDGIELSSELDLLGGEFDRLQGEVKIVQTNEVGMAENLAAFETELATANLNDLRQAVLTFRVWELVTRARLRLVEQNQGLAAADVQLALDALPALQEVSDPETAIIVQNVELRLRLAADNLPVDLATAISDLDIAWQELDALLATLLGGEG